MSRRAAAGVRRAGATASRLYDFFNFWRKKTWVTISHLRGRAGGVAQVPVLKYFENQTTPRGCPPISPVLRNRKIKRNRRRARTFICITLVKVPETNFCG